MAAMLRQAMRVERLLAKSICRRRIVAAFVSRALRRSGAGVLVLLLTPAGLSAAHDLALLGFRPVVFETDPVPAGMLTVGVPAAGTATVTSRSGLPSGNDSRSVIRPPGVKPLASAAVRPVS